MLVHEILETTAKRLPQKVALIEERREMNFGEVLRQVEALSVSLAQRGVKQGDRVALLMPNCLEFCIAYFAVLRLGAIVVPLNNRLAAQEFVFIMNDCGAETIVDRVALVGGFSRALCPGEMALFPHGPCGR